MPAVTPNRGYPYPLPADPADIPQAFQDLAEAIDNDVCALTNGVTGRPASRFRGTAPYTSITPQLPVFDPAQGFRSRLPFDTTDFNTANVTLQSQDMGNRLIFPEDPGFYFVLTTVYIPILTLPTTPTYFQFMLRRANVVTPIPIGTRLGATSNNVAISADDRNVRLMSLGMGVFMNGSTDAFSVDLTLETTPAVDGWPIGERTITLIKMTQS
jgi:hypothetical protein